MAGKRRLFFALWPDESVRRELVRVQSSLPRHGGRENHPNDLHVTLVFLGAVESERQACVEAVASGIQSRPFDLLIDQVDYWSRPRIPWCGPSEIPGPLSALVADLKEGLRRCEFEPETRPYAPHVTLARKARPIAPFPLEKSMAWPVREFVLAESNPNASQPVYSVLRRWAL